MSLPIFKPLTIGVRAAVCDGNRHVFLVRHTYVPGWHLPGGGVERGETVEAALRREVREEAAIEIAGTPSLHGVYLNEKLSARDHVFVYVVRAFSVIRAKQPDTEIAEAGFFAIDAMPEATTGATRRRIAEILSGHKPALTW